MSKKFLINFKKDNNNLSIKKEEKNNVDELGLSTIKSEEKEGYSPLNDNMKTHYANINDLINNKKEDIPVASEEVKEEVGVNNDIDNSNINSNSNNDIEKTTVVSLDEIDNELDKINKKEQPFFFNNNFMNKNKEEEKKENSKISGTCHCDCAVFRYPACHCSWITEEANTGMDRKTTGRMETNTGKSAGR